MQNADDVEIVLAELAQLDAAGLDAGEGLILLRDQIRSPSLRHALDELIEHYRHGLSLSQAMTRLGTVFHPVIRGLVAAGERSGDLGSALAKSASFLAMRRSVMSALRTAAFYPFAILTVGSIVSVLLAFFVLPHQWALVEKMHLEIWRTAGSASPSRMSFLIAGFAMRLMALVFLVLWMAAVGLALACVIAPNRPSLHRLIVRIPGVGSAFRRYLLFHFASVVDLQLSRGIPLAEALQTLAEDNDLPLVADAARFARNSLELGAPVSNGLAKAPLVFPQEQLWFLRHAETYECLPQYFAALAQKTAIEIRDIEKVVLRFEPLAIGVLGIIVAMILISVFLPISRWYQFIWLGE